MRTQTPRVSEAGTTGEHHEEAEGWRLIDKEVEQLEGGGIDPVQVSTITSTGCCSASAKTGIVSEYLFFEEWELTIKRL